MASRQQSINTQSTDNLFRLKPLVGCMRLAITGGVLAGAIYPAHAELPVPVPGQGWVSSGSASNQVLGNTLRIDQHSDRAILNWQSFNVGKENTVQFVQPGSTSVALNRIGQQDPSRILGQIVANGQVFLYNKNGFVFGKDSVVNTNSFLASTLNITDEVFERGITRVFDEDGRAALAVEEGVGFDSKTSAILIEAGAKIHTDKAGRIILVAPTINNKGSLSTDTQGQIIMAASQDKVYLQAANKDSPFAGLLVEVDTGGKVTHAGDILARQGNVTLAGFSVNQEGRINATTSVNVNGSIRLLAQEQHGTLDGTSNGPLIGTATTRNQALDDDLGLTAKVKLGTDSLTQIVADSDGGSAIDAGKQPDSYIEISGHDVEMQAKATIRAPSGKVNITATDSLIDPTQGASGRIHIDQSARIDVSGIKNVQVAMERNVGEISAQGFDLRNAPLQRDGVLRGETVRVDLRKGSQVVDTSGAEDRISRSLDERLSSGGEINLTASGEVIINDGAQFDISGGSVQFQDGFINTTQLITDYGRIVDISDADPNEHYTGIFGQVTENHSKWGVTKVWNILGQTGKGRFERGYTEGKDAGKLNIKAPRVAGTGELTAGAVSGIFQRDPASAPFAGSLSIDMAVFLSTQALAKSGQNVRFQDPSSPFNLSFTDSFPQNAAQPADLVLSTQSLARSGVQSVSVKTLGDASLAEGSTLTLGNTARVADGQQLPQPVNSLAVSAANIDIDGRIAIAGGQVELNAAPNTKFINAGQIRLGKQARIDVSGAWVNDLRLGLNATPLDRLAINGGSVKLLATGDLLLDSGSEIHADGGAWLGLDGQLQAGKGGDITLAATGVNGNSSLLTLKGLLTAYSLTENGHLTLSSGKILLGKADAADGDLSRTLQLGVKNGQFDFSQQLSFNQIDLVANIDDLKVKANVDLDLKAHNFELTAGFQNQASGGALRNFTRLVVLPEHLRQPLQLKMAGVSAVTQETGSSIKLDKGSLISLVASAGSVFVDGVLEAAAGQIKLAIETVPGIEYDPTQAIWVGENARLLAQGTTRLNPTDIFGRRSGQVLDGGEISFDAQRGMVILSEGSLLDVSGTRAPLDILQAQNASTANYATEIISSNAGKIAITAAEGVVVDGSLRAVAGSINRQGGQLSVTLDRAKRSEPFEPQIPFPNEPLVINITQTARRDLEADVAFGDNLPPALIGKAHLGAEQLTSSGFSRLSLESPDEVRFSGDVNLTMAERISIDAPLIRAGDGNGAAAGNTQLTTNILEIGASRNQILSTTATSGSGQFTANAQWLQLKGATRWDGFNRINLNSRHDLRTLGIRQADIAKTFVGGMVTAADLQLHASQIYPTTLTDFTFAIKNNPTGQITISGTNSDASPLSAGGSLTLEAPVINQQGVLKAPLGTINLKASAQLNLTPNSLTSVSAAGQLIPFGIVESGSAWLYPLDSSIKAEFVAPPEKRLVLSAPEIDIQTGSVVDIAGGGDLLAYEFVPGNGGAFDYLEPGSDSYQGGFAILPSLGSSLAPFDPFQSSGLPYALGSKVFLNASAGLAAGEYTLLPAHYALLPGAFLVTPQAGSQDQRVTTFSTSGLPIVAGYQVQAGTGIRDARSSGFRIENRDQVRRNSQYDLFTANSFFTEQAAKKGIATPARPMDSGQISLIAQNKLILDGQFMLDALQGGRGARMDIAADKIVVVNQLSAAPQIGTLELLDENLNDLHVDSLLLGGARRRNAASGETDLDVTAQEVVFADNSSLQMTDLIAAATDKVTVGEDVSLSAAGTTNSGEQVFNIVGDGALLRVSADQQVSVNRTGTDGSQGDLQVAASASLQASKSMILDGIHSTELLGTVKMQGGSINLGASSINIGEVDTLGGTALNLSNRKLSELKVDELVLTARDTVGVYGTVAALTNEGLIDRDANGLAKPLKFQRLVINSAGLSGFGAEADQARLQVTNLTLQNSAKVESQQIANGHGQLTVLSDSIKIGAGDFTVKGFDGVNISANREFRATAVGQLTLDGDLNLATAALTADSGANLKLNAAGHQAHFSALEGVTGLSSGFGGAISVEADSIDFNSKVLLPSGNFTLHSLQGNIALGEQAVVDLAGRAVKFADVFDYTPGGHFTASADQGSVVLAALSLVDVDSGGGQAAGGSLTLKAPEKTVTLLGQLQAAQGSARLDVGQFADNANFDSLMAALQQAGVTQSLYFRSRDADISQSATAQIKAHDVTLVADNGAMTLAGGINADGTEQGGNIALYAAKAITLVDGAHLTARGTGQQAKGGKILLSSTESEDPASSGIALQSGSSIDVSGNGASGGKVILRAHRTADGINIRPVDGNVSGYRTFYAEGVKKYANADLGDDGSIDSSDIDAIKTETADYMIAAQNNVANLASGLQLTPGVEINYDGDLTLATTWNLLDWRYGDRNDGNIWNDLPGSLTLRSSGAFTVEQSLSDGFKTETVPGVNVAVVDNLQGGASWSYTVTAGAALDSVDSHAVKQNGVLTIGSGAMIRTGSGDIQLNAGGNIEFTDGSSSVYNAGRPTEFEPFGTLRNNFLRNNVYSQFPVDGGDLILVAGGDIKGAKGNTDFNNWLLRSGNWADTADHAGQIPTAWGVALGYITTSSSQNNAKSSQRLFQQNVGSFGGGNVRVSAGGKISDLEVVMPTTGKQIGAQSGTTNFESNQVVVNGGGRLQVQAGGDIEGGSYFLGRGVGSLSAGGQITGGAELEAGPMLLMGDTQFTLSAVNGVSLSGVADPMILGKRLGSGARLQDVNFFSYSADSALNVSTLAGNLQLSALTATHFPGINGENQGSFTKIYPASLHATAFGGSIELKSEIVLFPSPAADLSLFAQQNISSTLGIGLGMSDAEPNLLPNWMFPVLNTNLAKSALALNPFGGGKETHATTPLHTNDNQPVRLVTGQGDISDIKLSLPKKALLDAGRDISNLTLNLQHTNLGDVSLIQAGRDLRVPTLRSTFTGNLVAQDDIVIEVGGPGDVLVKAGRDVNLGGSSGIITVGDTLNSSLADQGANLTVLTGANGELDYAGFISRFLIDSSDYAADAVKAQTLISGFMRDRLNNALLTDSEALTAFAELNSGDFVAIQPQLNAILLPVFFDEIKASGSASAGAENLSNQRGFAAIDTLFKGSDWQGDLSLFFSTLQTQDGGDINLLVPGGLADVGLAVAVSSGVKDAEKLGIIVKRDGNINAMVHNNFQVNTSRVFTLDGGDILIWSSTGDIDAGRGAKSALSLPPPAISFDEKGNLVIEFPAAVSGSGIRTAASSLEPLKPGRDGKTRKTNALGGRLPGDVFLIAPDGVVDAGEAGIGATNVTISATAVLGANNIQVGGVGTGVPVASVGSVAAGLTGASNLSAGVSQMAENSVATNDSEKNAMMKNAVLGMLSVEVLGFGE